MEAPNWVETIRTAPPNMYTHGEQIFWAGVACMVVFLWFWLKRGDA